MRNSFNQEFKTQMALRGFIYDTHKVLENMEKVFTEPETTVKDATIEFALKSLGHLNNSTEYFGNNLASKIMEGMRASVKKYDGIRKGFIVSGKTDTGSAFVQAYATENIYDLMDQVQIFLKKNPEFGIKNKIYMCAWSDLTDKLYH